MNKILYNSLLLFIILCIVGCDDENLPKANWETWEVSELNATIGDEQVNINWLAIEGSNPIEYFISWESSSTSIKGGNMRVDGNAKTAIVTELVNGETYKISVQPVYSNEKMGGKVTVSAKPISTRIPASNFIVAAGDKKVRLKWTAPESDKLLKYHLFISGKEEPIEISKELQSYEVAELTNGTEYEFSLVCVYENGTSDLVHAQATPGGVEPIIVATKQLTLNQSIEFNYNDMYFTMGTVQSVVWDFADGHTSTLANPTHSYSTTGTYTVKVTVTYNDATTESGDITVEVAGYAWSSMELNNGGQSGYVKVSNPVFSPDGTTAYIPTSSPNGHLFAVDIASGAVKWVSEIDKVTYGGGSVVDQNGVIYQCGTDSKVYAINPENGTKKWTTDVDGVIGAFPALSSTGVLYCATNSGTLYAIDTNNGNIVWNKTTGGTSSAVAVDNQNNIYIGTNSAIFKFNPSGNELWKTSETVNVTERGAFAMNASGTILYATQKGSAGLVAINMSNGGVNWTYPNVGGGDAYLPVVASDGTIFFNEKGSSTAKKIHAINSNGSLKWDRDLGASFTYCGLVIGDNGLVYSATQGKTGNEYIVYGLNTMTGQTEFTHNSDQQFMASASIGPDKRLYIGTIGANNIGSLLAIPIDANLAPNTWSVRGGNMFGTNSK